MLEEQIATIIRDLFGLEEVPFNVPPDPAMGDFSTAVCFALARRERRKPLDLAGEVKQALEERGLPYIREIAVTPPGYVNFHVDSRALAQDLLPRILAEGDRFGRGTPETQAKVFIEHTSVNPNKAMHIGHLRNAILGDTLGRLLNWLGYTTEVCNYIDDTGLQVVDVVMGLLYLDPPRYDGESADFADIWAKVDATRPFDHFCWDLYAEVHRRLEEEPELQARREDVLHQIEGRTHPVARFAKELATRIVQAHLQTLARLNIFYDLLNWESDILDRGFWQAAFETLRAKGALVYEESGPNAGCWVVPFGGLVETEEGVRSLDKILVRSNGTTTYTAKDVAYQMWKFGLLGADFLYRRWEPPIRGHELWTTAPDGEARAGFGHAQRVINVIDTRQSYAQDIVAECLRKMGYEAQARESIHLSYEVVALSKQAARALGVADEDKAVQAMSGRQGLGVKASDLIDQLVAELAPRMRDQAVTEPLAAAALRYYMLRFNTDSQIVFDFDQALATTGETGVYLEYAHARAASILRKAPPGTDFEALTVPETLTPPEKKLLLTLAAFPMVLREAGERLEPVRLTQYGFQLATAFTDYYERPDPDAPRQVPFIKIEEPALRTFRLGLVAAFRQVMANLLEVLGMAHLEEI